ncbi:hypothetical protein VTJ04DRAFT_1046 [Mycothermus thermophilus]|uniref:uncharacterized protein n=1 Tax=Humicola insolens TaxID=85995 RepID=UPI0037448C1E
MDWPVTERPVSRGFDPASLSQPSSPTNPSPCGQSTTQRPSFACAPGHEQEEEQMWRKGKFSTKPGKKHSKSKKESSLNRSLYIGTSDATTQRTKFHPHLKRYPKKQKRNPMRYPAQQLIQIASPDNITPIPTQRH